MYYIQLTFLPRYPFSWTQLKLSSSVALWLLYYCSPGSPVGISAYKLVWEKRHGKPIYSVQSTLSTAISQVKFFIKQPAVWNDENKAVKKSLVRMEETVRHRRYFIAN